MATAMAEADGVSVSISAVGKRLPPHCSAVGKVLLAHEPRAAVIDALDRCGMHQITERTIQSADELWFELASVRDGGTARDREGEFPKCGASGE